MIPKKFEIPLSKNPMETPHPHTLFQTPWNIVVTLGVKCNANPISRTANIRYYSSPFDNIDTVDGLVSSAKLMASEFKGHMDDVEEWDIKNVKSREGKIIAKSLNQRSMSDIQYPHFHAGWSNGALTVEDVEKWRDAEETDILRVWPYLKENFLRRQKRLVSILKSENSVLFLRVDTSNLGKRISKHNRARDLKAFTETLKAGYPGKRLGLLYFYYEHEEFPRHLSSSEDVCVIRIPSGTEEEIEAFVVKTLGQLSVLPRANMLAFEGQAEAAAERS